MHAYIRLYVCTVCMNVCTNKTLVYVCNVCTLNISMYAYIRLYACIKNVWVYVIKVTMFVSVVVVLE
jgi:hypothetical protein